MLCYWVARRVENEEAGACGAVVDGPDVAPVASLEVDVSIERVAQASEQFVYHNVPVCTRNRSHREESGKRSRINARNRAKIAE